MTLGILIVFFIFTGTVVTGQDDSIPVFNPACCYKKTVNELDYILVPGSAKGDERCLEDDCVYEAEGGIQIPGDRYCIASGPHKVTTLETETEVEGVAVTYSTDMLSFNTDIGFIKCTGLALPVVSQSKSITCSLSGLLSTLGVSDSSTHLPTAGPGVENDVPFIYSKSEDKVNRFSLHSDQVFINCLKEKFDPVWSCSGNIATDWNTIYVEAALPLNMHINTMEKCAETCSKNSACKFWSFSDIAGKDWGPATSSPHVTDNDREHRNHVGENECGIRTYTAEALIPTANGQSCGLRQENCVGSGNCSSNAKESMVYVAKMFPHAYEFQCLNACNADQKCNSWTFEYPADGGCGSGLCVLNYGITQRRINICPFVKCGNRTVLVSGNRTEHATTTPVM